MIRKEEIEHLAEQALDSDQEFLLSVSVSPTAEIRILVDSVSGISIERCVAISRTIEEHLDRDQEDFSLEVSSAGLGTPFMHPRQYEKHLGNPVTVVLKSGIRHDGVLCEVHKDGFSLAVSKVLPAYKDEEGKKHKKELRTETLHLRFEEVKSTAYRLDK